MIRGTGCSLLRVAFRSCTILDLVIRVESIALELRCGMNYILRHRHCCLMVLEIVSKLRCKQVYTVGSKAVENFAC